ncbi:MAG TPA: BTAD domain-containing putative transcriptional regulator, partial [Ktedonobacteraceae bacterium]|nr:BTAD domain-containing putative transcriptional regulator [Ktedonobacteraceae bacterium]
MSRLALSLLGPPRIERDGILVDVDTRKATALIAYLAVTRQRHSRDALAALLWPEYDQSHARATLRRTLSTLNKALNGPWLEVDRETLSLNFDTDLQVDVNRFHDYLAQCQHHQHKPAETCPACLDPLTQAVALYRGDFLAGFSLRDSPNFDDWQFYQADSLRRELAGALERLVNCHSSRGNYDSAIAYARRWLSLDRLHEPAYRQLMQLYAWAGQRNAALHQYRECVQVLEQELGVSPLESTTRLYQSIKENSAPPPPVQSKSAVGVISQESSNETAGTTSTATLVASTLAPVVGYTLPGTTYPLLGRSEEWLILTQAYDSIGAEGSLVILEGEAGIGKTRLAEEFLSSLRAKGATVIAARCYEGEMQLAYGPIVNGLRNAIAQKRDTLWLEAIPTPWLSEAARLLPELATFRSNLPPAPPLDSPGAQTRFFEGLKHILLALCSGSYPGAIFFDDVHWAD